jgi:hypothetical protein
MCNILNSHKHNEAIIKNVRKLTQIISLINIQWYVLHQHAPRQCVLNFSLCSCQRQVTKLYMTYYPCMFRVYTIMVPSNAHKYIKFSLYTQLQ